MSESRRIDVQDKSEGSVRIATRRIAALGATGLALLGAGKLAFDKEAPASIPPIEYSKQVLAGDTFGSVAERISLESYGDKTVPTSEVLKHLTEDKNDGFPDDLIAQPGETLVSKVPQPLPMTIIENPKP